jgi:hypothetical protein
MNTAMVANSKYFPGPMTTTEQGAEALEQLILSPSVASLSGAFFDGMKPAQANAQAYDAAARKQLADLTATLIRA